MPEQLGTVSEEAEAKNGAVRRPPILVFQADGGSVLLGRYADEEWSLPWTQISDGEFSVPENELEAAGRRLARELGLPSSAEELEYTGMCRFPELVRFSLRAPGLSALRSGLCGFDAVAFHRRDELPASLAPAARQLILAWWPDDHELVHHDHELGGAAGGAATSSARAPCPYKVHTYSEDGRRTGIVEKSALLELGAAPLPGGFEDIHSAYGEPGPAQAPGLRLTGPNLTPLAQDPQPNLTPNPSRKPNQASWAPLPTTQRTARPTATRTSRSSRRLSASRSASGKACCSALTLLRRCVCSTWRAAAARPAIRTLARTLTTPTP